MRKGKLHRGNGLEPDSEKVLENDSKHNSSHLHVYYDKCEEILLKASILESVLVNYIETAIYLNAAVLDVLCSNRNDRAWLVPLQVS